MGPAHPPPREDAAEPGRGTHEAVHGGRSFVHLQVGGSRHALGEERAEGPGETKRVRELSTAQL